MEGSEHNTMEGNGKIGATLTAGAAGRAQRLCPSDPRTVTSETVNAPRIGASSATHRFNGKGASNPGLVETRYIAGVL